ncbi:SpoIIE family protein phosphatase [Streptomyces sp. bgisy100]|uniref:SpoIIE family protein phosphatase n=1 Tax=Streptomyces sp. bgisy100 TaxID=3413783 RepID=UPI003D7232DD
MSQTDPRRAGVGQSPAPEPSAPGGLLDALGVAAVVLNAKGRIALWSPSAEELFGYTAEEALGRPGAALLVDPQHARLVKDLFGQVLEGASWAGGFPVRMKDGSSRLVEFRNMRMLDEKKNAYALGIATDQATLRTVETDLALSMRLISQSPIGLAVLDHDLRYVLVNPALERINGMSTSDHLGKKVSEALPFLDVEAVESATHQVLTTGSPLLDQYAVGRTPGDPGRDRAWSVSYYRLEDTGGHVLGVAISVVDVTERHSATTEMIRARKRLALIADAGVRIGTTLDLRHTARELAEVVVPDLADLAAVDILDSILGDRQNASGPTDSSGPAVFRALAVKAAYRTEASRAPDPAGDVAQYARDRLITQVVDSGEPILVPHVDEDTLRRVARDDDSAVLLARAGAHSYLGVPLIARGNVIGTLSLIRARTPAPFNEDDQLLAWELAARAAISIDNARLYRSERRTALALQRSLLPQRPPRQPGLAVAYRYQPAGSTHEVGGDWFDVLPLTGDKTALVVGDVMGSGISAAATMGQLRTATRTLTRLDLEPAALLRHLDDVTTGLDQAFATCVYSSFDPATGRCRISTAGHLPPVLVRPDGTAELIDVPTGVPLGVGEVPFETVDLELPPGSRLVLYTDGLVETRDEPIDARLTALVRMLSGPRRSLERTCDLLLHSLRDPDGHDDVALLVAEVRPEGTVAHTAATAGGTAEAPPGATGTGTAEAPPGTAETGTAEAPPGTAETGTAEAPPGTREPGPGTVHEEPGGR